MRRIFALLCCIVGITLKSQTSVAGGNVSGTWTPSGSPYNVAGSIMVPPGSTLQIQPGVTVNFTGHYKFLIKGSLKAIGTTANNILFTASNQSTGWYGIRIDAPAITEDSTILSFCKIEYGIANGSGDDQNGGGIFIKNFSKVNINNCTIQSNLATDGGGIYSMGSDALFIKNSILTNTAQNSGGGINITSNNPVLVSNLINNNASQSGGGLTINGFTNAPTVVSNTISNNSCVLNGGGLVVTCQANLYKNNISYNSCQWNGGAIYTAGSLLTMSANIVTNNTASGIGGVIYAYQTFPSLYNNIFANNTAATGGVFGYVQSAGTATISGNVFVNNTATGSGGAFYLSQSSPFVINNTFANNSATKGGVMSADNNSNPVMQNCIFWGNTAASSGNQVYIADEASDPTFSFNDMQGGTTAFDMNGNFYTGTYTNNIDSDPLFLSPTAGSGNLYQGITGNWQLQLGSPCINAGNPAGNYPATDIAGNPRIIGSAIDMGAYEFAGPVGIQQNFSSKPMPVYPNPFSTCATIAFEHPVENGVLEIYNALGEVVENLDVSGTSVLLSRAKLPAGVYSYKCIAKSMIYKGKFAVAD